MKCSEIVPYVMEQIALRKQSPHEPTVNAGGKAAPNRTLKGKKRPPHDGPVWVTFELPQRKILMGSEQTSLK